MQEFLINSITHERSHACRFQDRSWRFRLLLLQAFVSEFLAELLLRVVAVRNPKNQHLDSINEFLFCLDANRAGGLIEEIVL